LCIPQWLALRSRSDVNPRPATSMLRVSVASSTAFGPPTPASILTRVA
jgi:hypothetical protein